MAKKKFYVVWVGRKPGVYSNWADCQAQTNGFDQAKFKSFESREQAEKAYREGWKFHWGKGNGKKGIEGQKNKKPNSASGVTSDEIDYNSISVDVGTRGNPGPVEYQGVDTKTGEVIFSKGPISKGTNNLGEFLAIVHALAYLKKIGSNKTVYTDSRNAMKWIREKAVSTTLKRDASTAEIWDLIDRAEHWLRNNTYQNKILKWDTKKWGEIKADYGRKN
ncbi:ribonuclease H [Oceanobacillus piezotolerans]|uniref:Ribonuclease H n=1 Tax=Oceanobacillus piezotolerans TaxID=2448030 RepID=A0A498D2V6_9BACI|nr:ribonuclease H family protein [Oceanobacillus piezotolerans]RLL41316.1 ribonuclease H [Oceanobacillus piezotolerans]